MSMSLIKKTNISYTQKPKTNHASACRHGRDAVVCVFLLRVFIHFEDVATGDRGCAHVCVRFLATQLLESGSRMDQFRKAFICEDALVCIQSAVINLFQSTAKNSMNPQPA